MRTSQEIRDYVTHKMTGMLKHHKMWADTATGLETEYVQMLGLILFIDDYQSDRVVNSILHDWKKFAHVEIGFKGPWTVATWMKRNEKLDDDWIELTKLLTKFYEFVTFIPVSA